MSYGSRKELECFKVSTNIKLSLLWTSLIFLYVYNDYFSLYSRGAIEQIAAGRIGPLGNATAGVLVGMAILLAVPALMIFLSVALWPPVARWLNVVLGLAYTAVEALTLLGAPLFYEIVVIMEIAISISLFWYAARWPRHEVSNDPVLL